MTSNGNETYLATLNNWEMMSSYGSMHNEWFYQTFDGGLLSSDSQHVYFIGIIDIFTEFNTKKQMEHLYKAVMQDSQTISCVPPRQYSERFARFMSNVFTDR